ncbi:MAG: peptide-methionine (S)-S-oxide reductase MsrA [Usitatibacter sp.]
MEEIATLAGGCFWCLEAVFDQLRGVESVESGYMGGAKPDPTYEEVCSGASGHAEVVQVTFDPAALAYEDLLSVFFAIHDPTQVNRQGNDVGTQYRSAIFYHSEEQKHAAEGSIARLAAEKLFSGRIATEIVPATRFFIAEDYHQEYFARVGAGNPYCSAVIDPKVAKFRKNFVQRLKR